VTMRCKPGGEPEKCEYQARQHIGQQTTGIGDELVKKGGDVEHAHDAEQRDRGDAKRRDGSSLVNASSTLRKAQFTIAACTARVGVARVFVAERADPQVVASPTERAEVRRAWDSGACKKCNNAWFSFPR